MAPPPHVFFLITCLIPSATSFLITESLSDSVSAGDVIHYTLAASNPVVVVLISDEGDVDLYASPTHLNSKPTSDSHEIGSTSCGLDVLALVMNEDVKKYTLGVYGHVRYDQSKFSLYVIEPSEEDIKSYQVLYITPGIMISYPEPDSAQPEARPCTMEHDRKLCLGLECNTGAATR